MKHTLAFIPTLLLAPLATFAFGTEALAATVRMLDGDGWRIATDPKNEGREAKWFAAPREETKPTKVPWIIQDAFPRYHGVALRLSVLRDTNSLDEHKYTAEIDYAGEASDHGIPWGAFQLTTKNVTVPPMPCPFDGLVVSGTREDGTPVTIEAIAFMSKPAN